MNSVSFSAVTIFSILNDLLKTRVLLVWKFMHLEYEIFISGVSFS